jgi:diguanylate cyclase (GGDEF)-like protein
VNPLDRAFRTHFQGFGQVTKPLLLIVDDQPANIEILHGLFKEDCTVCMATSGADALLFCQNRQPDLILLDVVMPDMDGYEVCARLKADPLTQDIPIIFVTGQTDPMEEARGLQAGGVDFIAKPFHAVVVRARVRTHLLLKHQSDQLRTMALLDGLTGVANRRHFDATLQAEWRRCARAGQPLALIMLDVDFFKAYNDQYGHQSGDACLQSIAALLKDRLGRSHDMVARYGGEEFACILPDTFLEGAIHKAQTLEQAVRGLGIAHAASAVADVVTVSLGVAVANPAHGEDVARLIACADGQLYQAKQSGRGTVRGCELARD